MTDTAAQTTTLHVPQHPVRFITAASLFDGHDAAINIMRRILQSQGAEVIHLGHNRSVDDVVRAAVDEDVQGVCISSYQGGHMEYFTYLLARLVEEGRPDIRVYGGGGGVIVPEEIADLEAAGVSKIFSPADGARMGLAGMINVLIAECDRDLAAGPVPDLDGLYAGDRSALARVITHLEAGTLSDVVVAEIEQAAAARTVPVLGITGTGGSGKSSLTDELLRRFRLDQEDKLRIAVIAVDPTRRRGGGALLGDRIRMNSIDTAQVYFRSIATRGSLIEVPECVPQIVAACRAAGFDLVVVETPGIGQGDAAIVDMVDLSLYVMTPEFGAPSQLEKIDMLDFADVIAINKFERRGAADALRDVRRQWARNHEDFSTPAEQTPVFGTVAARFNDDGTTALYQHLRDQLAERGLTVSDGLLAPVSGRSSTGSTVVVPPDRARYLADIAADVRTYHRTTEAQAQVARRRQQLIEVREAAAVEGIATDQLEPLTIAAEASLSAESRQLLDAWPATVEQYRGRELAGPAGAEPTALVRESLSGTLIPRVALPRFTDHRELLSWLRRENLPGRFPFTAGVFPFKREGEDPARMFAGEGDAFRTNRRFHLLSQGQPANRLSTAFDSVTLYGWTHPNAPTSTARSARPGCRSPPSTT